MKHRILTKKEKVEFGDFQQSSNLKNFEFYKLGRFGWIRLG